MKMKMKMKNRLHRCDVKRHRFGQDTNKVNKNISHYDNAYVY